MFGTVVSLTVPQLIRNIASFINYWDSGELAPGRGTNTKLVVRVPSTGGSFLAGREE